MKRIAKTVPGENHHPAHLTRDTLVGLLAELGYLERAAAHLLSGWVPKIVSLHTKVGAAMAANRHMQRADGLRKMVWGLTRLDEEPRTVSSGARELMRAIDGSPSEALFLSALDGFLRPRLLDSYRNLTARCDSLLHEGVVGFCRTAMLDFETHRSEGPHPPAPPPSWLDHLEALWQDRSAGESLQPADALWPPLERIPSPARSPDLPYDEPGALRTIPIDANRSPRDIAINLHRNLDGEYTTMELVARNSYEHPDMPWRFHLDALRHASDEARHAIMAERLMADYGVAYGDFPVNTIGYDSLYEFPDQDPGSRGELLWRILLRQAFQEGMALDSLAYEIRRRRYLNQQRFAAVFEYLLADEVFHAESGLRWSRFLLGDDEHAVREELTRAIQSWGSGLDRRRLLFATRFPERALEEISRLEEAERHRDLPFDITLNRHARTEAGYSEADLQHFVSWGFVKAEDP